MRNKRTGKGRGNDWVRGKHSPSKLTDIVAGAWSLQDRFCLPEGLSQAFTNSSFVNKP